MSFLRFYLLVYSFIALSRIARTTQQRPIAADVTRFVVGACVGHTGEPSKRG